ncbi:hypothetical protein EX461_18020 [Vibrio parahaemolyticus]|nr:hypothetical protein [Vibrio parahaemolyticus]EJG0013002.1 hypothetical protein [Vibrio parahaemolyticus]EJS9799259.1 hypothetical protein [Vibrio parahaemolyticus]
MNKTEFLSYGAKIHKVKLETINKEVYLREMSYAGAVACNQCKTIYERAVVTLIYSLCDETGKNIFTMEDLDVISSTMTYNTIQEIAVKVAELSVTTNEDLVK